RTPEAEPLERPAGLAPSKGMPRLDDGPKSEGKPLDGATRDYFEPRLRADFSRVRIHADPNAAESARGLGALAYTVGDHIAFADGRYRPETADGKQLLAHELVQTIQQSVSGHTMVQRKADPAEVAKLDVAGIRNDRD